MAGQMIMQGFVGFTIPIWLRRLVTMPPAFIVVAAGADPTNALVLSQVVLSIALPFPMIALVRLTRRTDIMGRFRSRAATRAAAVAGAAVVLALNVVLVAQTFGVAVPDLVCCGGWQICPAHDCRSAAQRGAFTLAHSRVR